MNQVIKYTLIVLGSIILISFLLSEKSKETPAPIAYTTPSNRWTSEEEKIFIDGCLGENANFQFCDCGLKVVQEKYTASQVGDLYARVDKKELKEVTLVAASKCIDLYEEAK